MTSPRTLCMPKIFSALTILLITGAAVSGIYFLSTAAQINSKTTGSAKTIQHTNRLALEKSPYLLQHQHNPVDWYPWGQEAFDRAKAEDKLIFLSVGYSTCHWCHVMERESFENEDIAKIMNKHFVCVKVDREERPDVDHIYMTFVQATTGGGGWPMSVWLTPDLKPIVGATYFPPEDKFGRLGFPTVLNQIAAGWKRDRQALLNRGNEVLKALERRFTPTEINKKELGPQTLDAAYHAIAKSFDAQLGGFGSEPKFPRPVTLNFLQRYAAQKTAESGHREKAKSMALFTLDRMAAGGVYDHLGGGFHRYSVDKFWHVPHFEKMLYDQAQLTIACLEAFQVTGKQHYETIARDILRYVLRDMTDEAGGFYSAEDADSYFEHGKPEHGEGAFYIWEKKEIETVIGKEAAMRFNDFYGVKPSGNAPPGSDPHNEFKGRNILIRRFTLDAAAARFSTMPAALAKELKESREKLFLHREKRPRPHLDDKIITAWNGLMISAFARAHQVLDDPKYLNAATAAATFIKDKLFLEDSGRLIRSYREGASRIQGFVDDYAFLIQGLHDLYETSFDIQWLKWAQTLQETQNKLFWDQKSAGFYSVTGQDPSILLRLKEDYDGAEPSPNSISAMNLLRLAQTTANDRFRKQALKTLAHFSEGMTLQPTAAPQMLAALSYSLVKPKQIIFAAKPDAADLQILLRSLHKPFIPHKIVLLADNGPGQAYLGKHLPFFRTFKPIADKATAFVCEDFVCKLPATEVAQFEKLIQPRL
ncbi:MAG: Cellobiose 2-epimerase [Verrucomicrobia subdivision 3 bacterium]|nr:Cellobiose 2-epimerase [Limisphaerales bacterium]MCS1415451.1 Cellobiose 2-epimerase [Limisphaerales bacterium]